MTDQELTQKLIEKFGFKGSYSNEEIESIRNPKPKYQNQTVTIYQTNEEEIKTYNLAVDIVSGVMIGIGILAGLFFAGFLLLFFLCILGGLSQCFTS